MRLAALALLCALGCGPAPRPQLLLYVDTDAVVPELFDTLLIEVYGRGETTPCARCARRFVLDAASFEEHAVSIGIVPSPGAETRVRVRLYTSSASTGGELPGSQATIDAYASLPAVEEGLVERTLVLRTDTVGIPQGSLDAPVATSAGRPKGTFVGTWAAALRTACEGQARADEVCVPGGAFWMGNPRTRTPPYPGAKDVETEGASDLRRLVVVSPFYLQRHEVTVAELRAANLPKARQPAYWSSDPTSVAHYCTYTPAQGPNDALPVNCLQHPDARAYCMAMGEDLPSEAQYEFVASARRGALYAWGTRDDIRCDEVVYARAGYGVYADVGLLCRPKDPPGGALPSGSGSLDRVALDGGVIFDLAGNVSEWMLDDWNRQEEPCWSVGGPLHDPVCVASSSADGARKSIRGGSFLSSARNVAAAARRAAYPAFYTATLGVRCARPAQ